MAHLGKDLVHLRIVKVINYINLYSGNVLLIFRIIVRASLTLASQRQKLWDRNVGGKLSGLTWWRLNRHSPKCIL